MNELGAEILANEETADATVVRHALPRALPGYITVTMTADSKTFETNVIETDESEDHFAIGQIVRIDAETDETGNIAYSTIWRLQGAARKQRVRLLKERC